jgi:RNA polymerase sigma-70 factor (ECF subfamily)
MNVSIYYLKQSKKRLSTIPMNQEVLAIQSSDNNEEAAKWEKIRQQINALNLLEKGIIMLYLENKSYKEIAEIIGISETNVGTRLTRIKKKLKNKILKK